MRNNPKGFTLVELLVAAALFATVMVVAVNLFVLALRTPLIEVDNQHLQEEVNFMFELLAGQMSHSTIDYDSYTAGITNPMNELYLYSLTDSGTQTMRYYLSGTQVMVEDVTAATSYPLTTAASDDVAVDTLRFYIYPTTDPSDPTAAVNYQPAVAVVLTGHSVKDTDRSFKMQTLLTTRTYVR